MKLLIFGATGGTGQQLVTQALSQGHEVTAFVRRPEAFAAQDPKLAVVKGDIADRDAVLAAVKGHDVVLSALGTRGGDTSPVLVDGTRNILEAMRAHGVRRSLWVTSFGVGDSMGQMGWFARKIIVPMLLKRAIAEKEIQERVIRESGSDWIIARPGSLTEGLLTGVYRCIPENEKVQVGRPEISRADVADFLLKNLVDDRYLCQAIGLTY